MGLRNSLVILLIVFSGLASAKDIRLTWTAPELRTDGSKIETIDKFNLYYSIDEGVESVIEVDASATSHTVSSVVFGLHSFKISTVEAGQEGEVSESIAIRYSEQTQTAAPKRMMISGSNLTIELID